MIIVFLYLFMLLTFFAINFRYFYLIKLKVFSFASRSLQIHRSMQLIALIPQTEIEGLE